MSVHNREKANALENEKVLYQSFLEVLRLYIGHTNTLDKFRELNLKNEESLVLTTINNVCGLIKIDDELREELKVKPISSPQEKIRENTQELLRRINVHRVSALYLKEEFMVSEE